MAPSFSSSGSALSQVRTFQDGLDSQHDISQISLHNYITGATSPGVTLQGTLMNHSTTAASLDKQSAAAQSLSNIPAPFILGVLNSLYGGGAAGLSDTFGAGLWVMDFTLYAASTGNIKRLHFHQSNGAAYSAWSPVASGGNPPATYTPYYGKLAAARFLGRSDSTSVVEIPLPSPFEAAYAAYEGGKLVRIAVLNMREYNSTSTIARPAVTYSFAVNGARKGSAWTVERLTAAGSDVETGVSFGGYAYEYSTLGKAAKAQGVAIGESVRTGGNGVASVQISDSEAVVLTLS
jgi:hypothetical protein